MGSTFENSQAKWISNKILAGCQIKNVFHKQLAENVDDGVTPAPQNQHILFRKTFVLDKAIEKAIMCITADDYYKLYINGVFVKQGPAPGYPANYRFNEFEVKEYLHMGENIIAVHTFYQGLINRVWVSGDNRHGLLLSLMVNDKEVVASDESFKTHLHTGYRSLGLIGYDTQFAEEYDSRSPEENFIAPSFDDRGWENAKIKENVDYEIKKQESGMLTFETIHPVFQKPIDGGIQFDFGANYVGYFLASVRGNNGERLVLRYGQELEEDGRVRYDMRCCCHYEEAWILSGKEDTLHQFDYKSFRYVEVLGKEETIQNLQNVCLVSRHYPFTLQASMKKEYENDPLLLQIWKLCIHSQQYGVQEVIQDCMDREKGFYLGDGCYSAFTHYVLTGDDAMVRKLIDDSFSSSFISEGLVTCEDCSKMQEIAEYPLMLLDLILWHYRMSQDKDYLAQNEEKSRILLDNYRSLYEKNLLLRDLDRWCVVEWPKNYQDGYDVDITEGQICHEAHVSINAYYLHAVETLNKIEAILGRAKYRDEEIMRKRFFEVFYDPKTHAFKDGENTHHQSYIGNMFPFAFNLVPEEAYLENMQKCIQEKGLTGTSLFCSFLLLEGLAKQGKTAEIAQCLKEPGTYSRMLNEGATSTFEAWGKEAKWNTSLFHLTFSDAALFLSDIDLPYLFS